MSKLDDVSAMGFDDSFIRLWEYYLAYCEGGFRERIISTVQLALVKPEYRFDNNPKSRPMRTTYKHTNMESTP